MSIKNKVENFKKELSNQEKRQYELSNRMYKVLYPNDKPKFKLTTDDFMQLLFVMDELSMNPLFTKKLNSKGGTK